MTLTVCLQLKLFEKDDIGGLSSLVLRLNMIVLRISKALNSLRKMILIR